jgi:hypothetical protein
MLKLADPRAIVVPASDLRVHLFRLPELDSMRRALVIAIPLLLASIGGLVILAWTCFRRSPNRPPKKSSRRAVSTRAQLTRQVCFNTSAMARLDIPLPPLL